VCDEIDGENDVQSHGGNGRRRLCHEDRDDAGVRSREWESGVAGSDSDSSESMDEPSSRSKYGSASGISSDSTSGGESEMGGEGRGSRAGPWDVW
jgi:hypothetical protein